MESVGVELTARDREILSTVAERVRVITAEQSARAWWSTTQNPRALALRRMSQLLRSGHLDMVERLTRPETALDGPLADWRPGRPQPDLTRVSTFARRRSQGQPRLTRLYSASKATATRLAGARIRPVRSSETTHDVQLAGVYLLMRDTQPRRASQWAGEWLVPELLRARRSAAEKLPDAVLVSGPRVTAIEYVGTYSTRKLEGFHAFCEERDYAYELW